MSQSRKHRGYRTEKVVAAYLKQWWPYAEATGAGRSGKDITGVPFDCEVKARTAFSPKAAMDQVRARNKSSGELGFVVLRLNGQGESVEEYAALLPMGDLIHLLLKAGYRDGQNGVSRCKGCGSWIYGDCECLACKGYTDGK